MEKTQGILLLVPWMNPGLLFPLQRPLPHAHLQDGHMRLSGLQIRGHAMFSHEGLPIDSETLEYAWLVEVTVGELTGRVTAPQVCRLVFLRECTTIIT